MFYKYMQDGGPAVMWPIAALSVIATAVVLERLVYWLKIWFRRNLRLRHDVIEGRLSPQAALTQTRDPVVQAAYWMRSEPQRARIYVDRLSSESRRGIGLLEGIAGLSTSLGLFGTVLGVSMSFDSMSLGRADDVTHGLAVALYTTMAGLINYLYCFIAAGFFRSFGDNLDRDLELAEGARGRTPETPQAPARNAVQGGRA